MALNKEFWLFDLMSDGWSQGTLSQRDDLAEELVWKKGSAMTLRLIEYSHDEKPNIWYGAEIFRINEAVGREEVQLRFAKFGLPEMISRRHEYLVDNLQKDVARLLGDSSGYVSAKLMQSE